MSKTMTDSEHVSIHHWRKRMKKRRSKKDHSTVGELNLVAMMDMLTIILVFLLKSYSGTTLAVDTAKKFQFPKSTHVVTPQDATKITVNNFSEDSPGQILVDDELVLTLDKKTSKSLNRKARRRNYKLDAVHKKLLAKAALAKEEAKGIKGKNFEGNILVIADKEVPYWLLTSVLFTSAEAGFDKYSLVAVKINQ